MLRQITAPLSEVRGLRRIPEYFQRRSAKRDDEFTVEIYDGIKFSSRFSSHIGSQIYWMGGYSKSLIRLLGKFLTPDMVVCDVGANEGEETLFCAKRVAKVYAFEPGSTYSMLLKNIALNGFKNVEALEIGLGEKREQLSFYAPTGKQSDGTDNLGMQTTVPTKRAATPIGSIDVMPLDELNLPRLDLLKIDVEGAEPSVLRGARETIKRCHPAIISEVWEFADSGELTEMLKSNGYKFQYIQNDGSLSQKPSRDIFAS